MKKRQTRTEPSRLIKKNPDRESFDQFLDWLTDSPETDQAAGAGERFGAFETPSTDALDRFGVIPLLSQPGTDLPETYGQIGLDSWAGSAPAMRDITPGHIRRIQLKASDLTIEVVAERLKDRWEFVARAYQDDQVVHDFVLKVGQKKLLAKSGGFFHWTSKAVPRIVKLMSYQRNIVFEGLTW